MLPINYKYSGHRKNLDFFYIKIFYLKIMSFILANNTKCNFEKLEA